MTAACDVVIATRNRPEALARCLGSLLNQSESSIRVIVVDDCGETPLDDVLGSPALASLNVTAHRLARPSGPAAARNAGVELSDAEFIIFLDDDVRADWRMVAAHLANVRATDPNGRPIVSCGPFLEPPDWVPTPWNKWEAVKARQEAENLIRGVWPVTWRQFHTGNNCLPAAMFRAVGGFDETFMRAEDDELALRLHRRGCTFRFEPSAIAWHYPHRTLQAWLRIPRSYAVYNYHLDRLYPEMRFLQKHKLELRSRHPGLRAARLLARPPLTRGAVSASVSIASLLFRLGFLRPSMAALSAAYDLSYVDALRRIERADTMDKANEIISGR